MKTNSPANLDSLAAKKTGLTYWEYMEKTYGVVRYHAWGNKKETRQVKREQMAKLVAAMALSNNPMTRLMSQMRSLIGRNAY